MSVYNDVFNVTRYFYEVLIKHFLTIEKEFSKNHLFKRIDFSYRIDTFRNLLDLSCEAKAELDKYQNLKDNPTILNLALKQSECFSIFHNMIESQIEINTNLQRKAEGLEYPLNEYTRQMKLFNNLRYSMESELPDLLSLFRASAQYCE